MRNRSTIAKQFALIILSVLMIFGNAMISDAAVINDDGISPYYANIYSCSANLAISGIKAECKADIKANKSVNLKIKMELQKKKSSGYETVETWTSSKTGTILAMSKSRNINALCKYRLKVTFTAGSETTVIYKYE